MLFYQKLMLDRVIWGSEASSRCYVQFDFAHVVDSEAALEDGLIECVHWQPDEDLPHNLRCYCVLLAEWPKSQSIHKVKGQGQGHNL